jgi:hypothetical protein
MPAQHAINLVNERSIGCRGWISDEPYRLTDAIEASGLLGATISFNIGTEYLWVYLPNREELGDIEITCDAYGPIPRLMTIQRLNGPDHVVMPLLNLLASRLRELEIPHEITIWDEMVRDGELNVSAYQVH